MLSHVFFSFLYIVFTICKSHLQWGLGDFVSFLAVDGTCNVS